MASERPKQYMFQRAGGDILDGGTIERFLEHLANVREDPKELRRLQKQYLKIIPDRFLLHSPLLTLDREQREKYESDSLHSPYTREDDEEAPLQHLPELRATLRKAWRESDPRLREWHVFDLRRRFHRMMNPDCANEPPDLTIFEWIFYHFQTHLQRARYCQNPECFNPYYISTHMKPTRFCGPKCAGSSQRAAKLKWWDAHKKEMLRKRKARRKGKGKGKP